MKKVPKDINKSIVTKTINAVIKRTMLLEVDKDITEAFIDYVLDRRYEGEEIDQNQFDKRYILFCKCMEVVHECKENGNSILDILKVGIYSNRILVEYCGHEEPDDEFIKDELRKFFKSFKRTEKEMLSTITYSRLLNIRGN